MKNKAFLLVVILLLPFAAISQNEDTVGETIVIQDSITKKPIDPLRPSRAAFYSAILPGLGQAYNKKYWKIPIVYAALGTGIYFYADNNKDYKRYRNAYKRRLAGFSDDEFWGENTDESPLASPNISNDGLIRAQRTLRRNKEISLLVTIGIYALNIIDANVDAHLLQYNVDDNLAIKPHFNFNDMDATTNLGLTLDFKF
ncbi:DUF5683 domain-containing protein [Pontimicrobium aquaticum]|uniref:DUF5683 domain-containing protein n=1 Tax=Pontimicrobium aquaticum TaxID=2565367 RepID=A0A4U0EWN4_9FLAO|nr:DUF5683 domain-containing protein [Pontimicrobium aquaticum]TJY36260.1 hypothetical protein E5167_06220 [Pontimicrobium aquaticum]